MRYHGAVKACRMLFFLSRRGFTLPEVVLVIGIIGAMLALTLMLSTNAIGRSTLRSTENILVQSIRRAQTLSQQNVGRASHGVYIREGSSIIIFSGTTFSSRSLAHDQAFELSPNVVFSGALYMKMVQTPPNPDGRGLVFTQLAGEPTPPTFSGKILFSLHNEERSIIVSGKGVVEH